MEKLVLEPKQNAWDPQPCVAYMLREFGSDKKLYMVGRCLAQIKEEQKECVDALAEVSELIDELKDELYG